MRVVRSRTLGEAFAAVNYRGPGFDTLRLLTASAVIYHHASALDHDIVHDAVFGFTKGYTQLGLLAVSVFFALSGFLVTPGLLRSGDVVSYFSRRFVRIMPLLAVMTVVGAFVVGPAITKVSLREYFSDPLTWTYLKNVTTSLSLNLPGIANEVGSAKLNTPMWTLRFEWLCYIALAGASVIGLLRNRYLFLALYVAVQVIVFGYYGFLQTDVVYPGSYLVTFLFAYFGAGTLLYLFRDQVPVSATWAAMVAGCLLVGLWLGLGPVVAPICVAYLVTAIGLVRFPWSAWLGKADISYGVYLIHHVILTILVNVYPFTSGLALFAVGVPVTYLAAWVSWTFLEKPALRHKDFPAKVLLRILPRRGERNGLGEQVGSSR